MSSASLAGCVAIKAVTSAGDGGPWSSSGDSVEPSWPGVVAARISAETRRGWRRASSWATQPPDRRRGKTSGGNGGREPGPAAELHEDLAGLARVEHGDAVFFHHADVQRYRVRRHTGHEPVVARHQLGGITGEAVGTEEHGRAPFDRSDSSLHNTRARYCDDRGISAVS